MTDNTLLQSLFPYSKGLLAYKAGEAITNNHPFSRFHEEVLKELVPPRLLAQVVNNDFIVCKL